LSTLYNRLCVVERDLERVVAAPTYPIYDVSHLPQDDVKGQIALGKDNSINWYDGTTWNTKAGTLSGGTAPQDAIPGQVAIGSDNSLNWYVNGAWYGAPGNMASGNPPQDAIQGQLVVGTNSICWFVAGAWYGF